MRGIAPRGERYPIPGWLGSTRPPRPRAMIPSWTRCCCGGTPRPPAAAAAPWQPVSPPLMTRLVAHGRKRHAPDDQQLLRYPDGRPITSRRHDHLRTRLGLVAHSRAGHSRIHDGLVDQFAAENVLSWRARGTSSPWRFGISSLARSSDACGSMTASWSPIMSSAGTSTARGSPPGTAVGRPRRTGRSRSPTTMTSGIASPDARRAGPKPRPASRRWRWSARYMSVPVAVWVAIAASWMVEYRLRR